ncbi:hypothetical protein SISNIDRAFT_408307 [Sistotremastrum niveocremeum HHB9708]|uniref:Amino-acid acetyltransferase, mitochondrial n=1 Tax=Sistotremastrum niveocremeum HHB9708 TaxID=1314777 RepID=A0A164X8Z8_9AGAM|nr:hypothetical protein SISNIDRAFT_408307 [Sistotremastrum niveocremeum HHB9708]
MLHQDFIMSILRAKPSLRDSQNYLNSFGARSATEKKASTSQTLHLDPFELSPASSTSTSSSHQTRRQLSLQEQLSQSPVIESILDPVHRRTALVKVQGPFTDRQLESIARGLVYLEKLGLVSVIVVEDDKWEKGSPDERVNAIEQVMLVTSALEKQGAKARPLLETIVHLGPKPEDEHLETQEDGSYIPEAHAYPKDLNPLRSALRAGEIPVLPPLALDSFCRSVRIHSNDVIAALARGMVEAAAQDSASRGAQIIDASNFVDLTPLRLMIINREGGIPSYARSGFPHLLVNLESEYSFVRNTFNPEWYSSNPTALSNLELARTCLGYMPTEASAVMVSHRSQKSLIGNLITNKPALSSSLPHAFLQNSTTLSASSESKLTKDTPTLIRKGLPITVIKRPEDIDKGRMTRLLEGSFGRTLDQERFYERLEKRLDFAIVAGDYVGAAIVTTEPCSPSSSSSSSSDTLAYLDKFAVLPSHQGDGTVDFLWVALHDESYGLGLSYSVNPNGGREGQGIGRDLIWRSRGNNPVNKWYFERSSGHIRLRNPDQDTSVELSNTQSKSKGDWVMFWCDAERRLRDAVEGRAKEEGRSRAQLSYLEDGEQGRIERWAEAVGKIPSSWI